MLVYWRLDNNDLVINNHWKTLLSLINRTYLFRFLSSFLFGWRESPCASLRINPSSVRHFFSSPAAATRAHATPRLLRDFLWELCCIVWGGGVRCCGPVWGGWEQIGGEDSFKKKRLQILFSVRRWNVRGRSSQPSRGFSLCSFLASRGYLIAFHYFYTNQGHKHLKNKTII